MSTLLPSLLLVEDDSFQAMFFLRVLEEVQAPIEFHHAVDGVEALERLADPMHALPNLIVLDINMPRLDGFQTLERIRCEKRLCQIPVFMFSTSEDPNEIALAYKKNASGYLRKPEGREEMNRVVKLLYDFVTLNLLPDSDDVLVV